MRPCCAIDKKLHLGYYKPSVTKSGPGSTLTHGGRDKMDAISRTTFSSAFCRTKMFEFRLHFHWSLFLRVQLTIFQHWCRYWLGAEQATSHYLNQWWPSSTTHICVTRPQWVKARISNYFHIKSWNVFTRLKSRTWARSPLKLGCGCVITPYRKIWDVIDYPYSNHSSVLFVEYVTGASHKSLR